MVDGIPSAIADGQASDWRLLDSDTSVRTTVFASAGSGPRSARSASSVRPLTSSIHTQVGFSPDGAYYMRVAPPGRTTAIAPVVAGRAVTVRATPVTNTADTMGGDFSPDGRRVAYLEANFGSQTAEAVVVVDNLVDKGAL